MKVDNSYKPSLLIESTFLIGVILFAFTFFYFSLTSGILVKLSNWIKSEGSFIKPHIKQPQSRRTTAKEKPRVFSLGKINFVVYTVIFIGFMAQQRAASRLIDRFGRQASTDLFDILLSIGETSIIMSGATLLGLILWSVTRIIVGKGKSPSFKKFVLSTTIIVGALLVLLFLEVIIDEFIK